MFVWNLTALRLTEESSLPILSNKHSQQRMAVTMAFNDGLCCEGCSVSLEQLFSDRVITSSAATRKEINQVYPTSCFATVLVPMCAKNTFGLSHFDQKRHLLQLWEEHPSEVCLLIPLTIPLVSSFLFIEVRSDSQAGPEFLFMFSFSLLLTSLGLSKEGHFAKCIWKNEEKLVSSPTNLQHHIFKMQPHYCSAL